MNGVREEFTGRFYACFFLWNMRSVIDSRGKIVIRIYFVNGYASFGTRPVNDRIYFYIYVVEFNEI